MDNWSFRRRVICFNGAEGFPGDGSADDDRAKTILNQTGGEGINLQAATVFHGNSNNEFRVSSSLNNAIKFWDFKGTVPWTFHGVNTSGNRYNIGIYNEHAQAGATNVYQGPILMEGSNIEFQFGQTGYDSTFLGPATF
ncbi:MAG: hypothetical protein MJ157_02320, partial [Clostridia bacterium]|nr:hypothetical protein [Clostridia bacterium]